MFSVATIFLVSFALNLQDAVYAQNNTTYGNTSSISFSTTSMSWVTQNMMITATSNSPTQNPPVATSTSTSMSTPSTTGTISPSSVTTAVLPKKTCGVVKATLEGNKPASLEKFLQDFYFNDTKKYTDVKITELMEQENTISFKVCLNFNTTGYFEDDAVKLLNDILSVSNVEVEITGVSDWKAAEGQCEKKCSSEGAAGPLNIERECNDKYSCKGVKTTDEAEGCDKYCPESGAVSFMVSYLLVAMGIALSLSFYL